MRLSTKPTSLGIFAAAMAAATAARAESELPPLDVRGAPEPGGMSLQNPVTSVARDTVWLDDMLIVVITLICVFVLGLIAYVMLRYNQKANPTPARFTHHTPIEVAWTVVPVLILVFIGIFSVPVLFKQQVIPDADVTIKTTGYQWYWGYEYPDEGISFQSFMLERDELEEHGYDDSTYLLATDTAMVVPTDRIVQLQVTAADVIHSWTIPAFGVKQDGVPGRLGEAWFEVEQEGIYFGQCSEICGINHAYMPITVKAVSPEEYDAWVERQGGGATAALESDMSVAAAD